MLVKGLLDDDTIPDDNYDWVSSNMETSSKGLLKMRCNNIVEEISNVEDEEENTEQI